MEKGRGEIHIYYVVGPKNVVPDPPRYAPYDGRGYDGRGYDDVDDDELLLTFCFLPSLVAPPPGDQYTGPFDPPRPSPSPAHAHTRGTVDV